MGKEGESYNNNIYKVILIIGIAIYIVASVLLLTASPTSTTGYAYIVGLLVALAVTPPFVCIPVKALVTHKLLQSSEVQRMIMLFAGLGFYASTVSLALVTFFQPSKQYLAITVILDGIIMLGYTLYNYYAEQEAP